MRDANRGLLEQNINFTKKIRKKRQNVIKRGMLLFMAIRLLPDERYQTWTQLFKMLDIDADGYLQCEEIQFNVKE